METVTGPCGAVGLQQPNIQYSTTKGGARMKKLSVVAVALMLGTGIAVASSLAIPWFVDTAPRFNGIPGAQDGVTGLI